MGQRLSWMNDSPILNQEWVVADSDVLDRAKNYRSRLRRIWKANTFAELVEPIRNKYLQYDLKLKMTAKAYQDIYDLLIKAEEDNDVKLIVKAYTMTNNFYELINTHLANLLNMGSLADIGLDPDATQMTYWHGPLDFACILLHHEKLEKCRLAINKRVFRGMTVPQEVVDIYRVNTHLMNKTFVSTSQAEEVALMFAKGGENLVSCLCIYTLGQGARRTALDISEMSAVESEEEVLILPYTIFEVTDIRQAKDDPSRPVDFIIELQEFHYEDD